MPMMPENNRTQHPSSTGNPPAEEGLGEIDGSAFEPLPGNKGFARVAETASATRQFAIARRHPCNDALRVLVVGGGPAGQLFACLLKEYLRERVDIIVYDGRLTLRRGRVWWKSASDGVRRREQVVTIQSLVTRRMPSALEFALFPEGGYTEMWPTGGESPPTIGPPRNIRILDVENRLLAYALEAGVEVRPGWIDARQIDLGAFDIVVAADGPRSRIRDAFAGKFGEADPDPFSIAGRQVTDVVLGLRVKSRMPDPDAVILTLIQQRFLMNGINGDGCLYMRLSPEEVREVRGIAPHLGRFVACSQRRPCHYLVTDGTSFAANDNVTRFAPVEDPNSFLWPRILEGLRLFEIPENQLYRVTTFRLAMARRGCFTAELTETGSVRPVFGALIGDSALALNFWPGRGMNSAFTAAQSLARTLANRWQGRPLRMADFVAHEASMAALQHRHADRAWRNVVIQRGNVTLPIATAMGKVMAAQPSDRSDTERLLLSRIARFADRLVDRLPGHVNRAALAERIAGLSPETLAVFAECGGWETALSSGPEVDLDQLNPLCLDDSTNRAA